jgi:alpha-L-fucosidase
MSRKTADSVYANDADYRIAEGPFEPTWESLQGFGCPEWFRDAKLGFWAHWGPQAVPMYGDWYARHMYVEGSDQYRFHLRTYGHPSRFGFKDVCALWKAERFDPEALISLYKEAGARYFVALAVHHDNFDCWASRHHGWNSVNVGPQKDIVGLWKEAAARHGLRFGVTEHLERSYSWFNTNKLADKAGPFAGVPYDGASPQFVDFYFPPHGDIARAYPANPPDWWKKQWFQRIRDLVDQYEPDLLYTDGAIPFGGVGRRLVAHLYNQNAHRHGGKNEAVYTLKNLQGPHALDHGEYVEGIGVLDMERGVVADIQAQPWQTDTCIGGWYYDRRKEYKTAAHVIHMLIDIVSKNGNLLLNFPLRPDGTLDDESQYVVQGVGRWMAMNGETIYETRPWRVFGEGPTRSGGGAFNEAAQAWTAEDFRFVCKGDTVYAFQMEWPANRTTLIKSLKLDREVRVQDVRLVGHEAIVPWSQTVQGLQIDLPPARPSEAAHVFAVRVASLGHSL